MSRDRKKNKRSRWPAADHEVEQYFIDDLHFQSEVDRTQVMKHPVSSRRLKFFYPSRSPVKKTRGAKSGFAPRDTRCSSSFRPGAERTPRLQSDWKSGRIHSCSTPVDTSKVLACQSLNEDPTLQQSHVGEDASSAFERSLDPGGEFSRISSQGQALVETSKEKPLAQSFTQDRKWCLTDHCSSKNEEVDSIFQGEETLDNLRQRLAIYKEAIDYFIWASYSPDGPPCSKTKMAAMDNHLSFRDFCQSLVRSRVSSVSDPATNEPSGVGEEHQHDAKIASNLQEVNTDKSENTAPIDLPNPLSDKRDEEHQRLCNTNDNSEIEEDQRSFHGTSLGANTEKAQCTARDSDDKELLKDTSEPLENIALHREPSSVESWQRSRILSPISMTEDAYCSFQKDYNDDEEWSEQRKMNDPTWRNPPYSQNRAFLEASIKCNHNGRSYAAKKGTVNQMASPLYHRSTLDRSQFPTQAKENRYFGSTERYDYPNRSYRDDNRFYGQNYGSQRYDDNCWPRRDNQEHSSSNHYFPRDYKDNGPRRFSSPSKRHASFGCSSMSVYCEARDGPPLYTSQRRNYPRPDSIKVEQLFGFGLSESRVSQASRLSDHDSYKDWTAQGYTGLNTPGPSWTPQAHPRRNNQKHNSVRRNYVDSVDTSDCSLTFNRGEGYFKQQAHCGRLEDVAMEINWPSLDAPANTSCGFKPVESGVPESAQKGCVDQAKPHLSEEKEFNKCQNSYRRPHPIEFADDEKLLKPHTQHAMKTEEMESQTSRNSSVSIYSKIPSCVLKLCVPSDPRRQYLVVGDSSYKEWDWRERRSPLLRKLMKEYDHDHNKAQKESFNNSDFKSHKPKAYIKKERCWDERIVFCKKNTSTRTKFVAERKESTNLKKNSELNKAQILHLLDDICTVPEPVLPLPEEVTLVEKSRASPNLILNQRSTLADECSTQFDASSTRCDVSNMMGDVSRTDCDARSTGCDISNMMGDVSRAECDARSTGCDISSMLGDVSRTDCDTGSTGCDISRTMGYNCSKGDEDDNAGFDIESAFADACCTGWDVSNMLSDTRRTERDATSSGFDISSKFGDVCNKGHDPGRMGIDAFCLEGDICPLQERTRSGSDFNGIELNSKSCSRVIESEMVKLMTIETPKSLRQLCLSILAKYPCPQTDTLPYLENVISLSDHLIARDFLRAPNGSQYHRPKYNKRTFRESFVVNDCSQFAKCPRGNTPPREQHLTTRPFRRHMRQRYVSNSNANNSNGNNSNGNNSNESGDERDAEYGRQTNRTPDNCDRFILDDMSTPIVLSAADRVYHVSSRCQGWSSETIPIEANITHEDTARAIDYLDNLVSSETTSRLSNDDFTQADFYVSNVFDFGQESDLLEADGPVINSRDMLQQAMSSAGLDDFLVDGYMRCDQSIKPLLIEQLFEADGPSCKALPNFPDTDYQCRVFDVDKAVLEEEMLDFLDVAVEGATDTNDVFGNSSKEKWRHQEVYEQIGYNHGYSNCCTKGEYSIFGNEKLDSASPDLPGIMLAPLESANTSPRSSGHGELDELFFSSGYCYKPNRCSTASKLLASVDMVFPGFIPGFGSTSPPYCEELCGITQDSQQLTEALGLLSEQESFDSDADIQASSNIPTTDDERTLHQTQDVSNDEMITRKRKMLSSNTSSESLDETTNTTEGSESEPTQRQQDSEKFVRAVAAFTSYDVGEIAEGQSSRGENRKGSRDKGGSFVARTLDCVKRYGRKNRQPNKKSSEKDVKFRDRGSNAKVKIPKERTKGKTSRIGLDEVCIVDCDTLNVQNALGVSHLKTNVLTTNGKQWATETPCVDRRDLGDRTLQEATDDTLQEVLTQENVNQDSGETQDGSQVGCDTPGTNAGPKDDNDFDKLPTAGVVEGVSVGTLTKYFDRQQESMELFTRQLSKLSPGFLKHQGKGPPPQIKSRANRIATKIVYCMKCNRSKPVNAGMKAVDETCQQPPGDNLDYNNNASWDNIEPGNSKMKVAKTDKGKDPKKVPSNESRLHLPRVFDKGSNLEKDKKKLEKISEKFRKQYQSIHQAPSTLSLFPLSGVAPAGNVNRSHVSSAEMGQLPEIGQARSGNENQNKSPMYGACTLPVMKASVQENSKVLNFVKRLDSLYGDQLARGDVDTSRRLKKCCKSYLNKHTGSKISVVSSMDKKKNSPITCTPCTTSDKIEADINFLAAHNSNLLDPSECVNPTTKETQPVETPDSLPPEATKLTIKPGNDGDAPCSGQGSAKNTNASSAKKLGETKVKPSPKKAPPLRSDIATSVNRLTTKPPSPTTRLMYKIQSYEQEFKKPFNINECSRAKLAKAAPKFFREKYTRDIQKLLPLCGGSGETMTRAHGANKPKLPMDSASKDSLQGGHASKIATKALGGLPKRFEDFPDGAIKEDQLETRQTIMASLPSELKLGDDKVPKKSVLVVDSVKTPSKISPSNSVVVNERESDGTNLEIKSLAQLKQVSERSFSLEFPDIFDQHQRLSPLSNAMAATVSTTTMNRHSAEVSSVKCDTTLTNSQDDMKQIPTSVSSSTTSAQKEFYSVALPAGISEELLKELETDPEPKSECEEVKSLQEELEEFLNVCGVDEKDNNDFDIQEFDGIDVDEEELKLLKNGSGSDQPENRSVSDQLGNGSGSGQPENRSGSDQLENGSRGDKPSDTKIVGESDSLTSPSNCSHSNETKPGCEKAAKDDIGFESLGGICDDSDSVDQRPGSGDGSSCDVFKVESLTSIKKSLDYAFDDQFNDVSETCVEGKKKEDNFWGDATDYWTNPSSYLPGPKSFKKLTPIQEDLEEDECGSMTSNEQ